MSEDGVSEYGGRERSPVRNVLHECPIPLDLTVVPIPNITFVQMRCFSVPRNRKYKLYNIVNSLQNTRNPSSEVHVIGYARVQHCRVSDGFAFQRSIIMLRYE